MTMMNSRFFKTLVLTTAIIFVTSLVPFSMALASTATSKNVDLEITVRVNQKGFLDPKGKGVWPQKHSSNYLTTKLYALPLCLTRK